MGEKAGGGSTPLGPSLWNDSSFDAVELYDHHFFLSGNFLGDYQWLIGIYFATLSNLLEVQLLRCFLVGMGQREKHSHTIHELKFKINFSMRSSHEGEMAIKVLIEK